jgi:hypothetical protein
MFRIGRRAAPVGYLGLALVSPLLIHVTFALFLGWNEYLPFLLVPSLAEVLG